MRLIFMGTPDFAVVTLKALLEAGHHVACVYSQPPRPAGRGMALRPSPVHAFAEAQGIEVRTPTSLKSPEEQARFTDLKSEAAIVVAYGLLLPQAILDAPRFGCFNVHASLLPRWRGAAPLQRAIMAGDHETGVTIMRMELGLDTGPMVKVVRQKISTETTTASLHDELAALGAAAMVDVLKDPAQKGVRQPEAGVTYAQKISKLEARIDFTRTANDVRNHIHGLSPFPGAWFMANDQRVKVLRATFVEGRGAAGEALTDQLIFACGEGAIQFDVLQREGKGAMARDEFMRGFSISQGTVVS
jgi:methionyl-tRNA formyltransferase